MKRTGMTRNAIVTVALLAVAAPGHCSGASSQPLRAAPDSPSAARAEDAALPALFRGDPRLDARVTLAEKSRPLGELVSELGQQIGVRLSASGETADDKVTLFLDGRPAAEVLALIARHFRFQWRQSHRGYELTQDLAGRAREAALRERGRAAQIAATEARMEQVARFVSETREQQEARGNEIQRQLSDPNLAADEQARLIEEQMALQDAERPGAAAATAIYRALTPEQRALLRAGGEIRLSTRDGSLPPPLAEAVRQAAAQQMQHDAERMVQRMAGGGAIPGAPPAAPTPGPAGGAADVAIHFSTAGFRKGPPRPEGPPLQLRFTLSSEPESGSRRRMLPVNWWPMLSPPGPKPGGTAPPSASGAGPPISPAPPPDPELQRVVELTFPHLKVTPGSEAGGGKGGFGPGKPPAEFFWPGDMPTLGDIGEAVHRATGLEVIADSFIRDRLEAAKITGRRPLVQILDAIAGGLDYDWKKEGHLLRFRSRLYYQDRFAEVPDRILRPWLLRVERAGAPSLDDLAGLAAALNDDQCSSMQEFWGWYLEKSGIPMPPGPADFADNRYHLRFWAARSPVQKRAALSGAVVPVSQMDGLQQRAFQAALIAPEEGMRGESGLDHSPSGAEFAAGGFSLEARQLRQELATGSWPDGGSFMSVTRRLVSDAADPSALTGPNSIPMQPVGPPTFLDSFNFTYHLGGETTPARTASIDVPRPQRNQAAH